MDGILKKKWVVVSIAIFCAILWGSAFPVLKVSYDELQMAPNDTIAKIVFAGWRFLMAGLILLIGMLFVNWRRLLVTKRQFMFLVLFGIIQTALQYYFFYNGLGKVSGMQGAILVSSGTFFTVILAHFFYHNDRLNWKKAIGLVAGFGGVIVANWGSELQLSFQLTGEGYMILAALTGAIGTIMAKELAVGIHPFALTGWQLTIGAALLLVIGLPRLDEGAITFTPLGYGLLIYSALLSAAAFALWYSILKYNKAGEISMFKFITPVSGAILSAMFVPGERLNLFIIGALFLVAVGIIAVNYKGRAARKAARAR
ncbi:DMT family transporter [Virgibacillus halodenitrificans]|uniref:DMT family transporter n=1 Tax=Virgibacillus halodenitrificans TaxID=1482 RepID=A0ABR7VLR0_VIRHA|nr:DMT family transporter [Virgibacillus halodenitrificans]MBD1221329.1 DMT family transporter [Virgibacillus halodenitrificans]MCJ0929699.1 DMT family transporter [Virgibacillus halodenitrificans]MYL56053.1 EamA family transporter [Virgibacillus halodenitrificans]